MQLARNGKVGLRDLGFVLVHLIPLIALFTHVTPFDWVVCGFLYFFRMFFVTAGYHRYFSHRTFKTSRVFQFLLAFFAQTTLQKGALWWAYARREHHRYSDSWDDPHSRLRYGFWYSHIGWILDPQFRATRYDKVHDFAKFRELVWLNTYYSVPWAIMGLAVWLIGDVVNGGALGNFWPGLSTFCIGFCLSTVLVMHGTFTINSLMHLIGGQRYETGDESRNSFILTLVTLGDGWHNNHHYYPNTARIGFFWWEFDPAYYVLKILSWLGIVWDLRTVPDHIKHSRNMKEAQRLAQQAKHPVTP